MGRTNHFDLVLIINHFVCLPVPGAKRWAGFEANNGTHAAFEGLLLKYPAETLWSIFSISYLDAPAFRVRARKSSMPRHLFCSSSSLAVSRNWYKTQIHEYPAPLTKTTRDDGWSPDTQWKAPSHWLHKCFFCRAIPSHPLNKSKGIKGQVFDQTVFQVVISIMM